MPTANRSLGRTSTSRGGRVLNVGDHLFAISEAGLAPKASKTEKTQKVYPLEKIAPELDEGIREHKADVIKIMRGYEEMGRTGIINSERQVFELAREHFGKNGGTM